MSATGTDVDDVDRLGRVTLSRTIEPGDLRVTGLVSELGVGKVLGYLEAAGDVESHWGFALAQELGRVDPAQVLERQARRALPAGRILLPGDIIAPPLIRRGDAVTLFIDQGPIHIRMPGVALADGGQGSRIAVRNTRSGRRVEGIVRDAGRVEVPG